jgi:ribosomal protein S18 acetylase RimI-like enzyme
VGVTIRPAEPQDSEAMGRVHVAAWQRAYRGLMPDDFLDGLDSAARGRRWHAALLAGPGGGCYREGDFEGLALVVEGDDAEVAGISVVGPPRRPEPPSVGELWMINLAPTAWGRGLGRALLASSIDALRGQHFEEAVLWVVSGNAQARRFYERAGWHPDGTQHQERRRGFDVVEARYRRSL